MPKNKPAIMPAVLREECLAVSERCADKVSLMSSAAALLMLTWSPAIVIPSCTWLAKPFEMQAAVVAARANDEDESKRKRAHSLGFGSAGEGRGEMFALECGHSTAHDFFVLFITWVCLAHFDRFMFEICINSAYLGIVKSSRNTTSRAHP